MPDNVGHMFYYGRKPWHEKGTELQNPATAEQALQAGGLNWEVGFAPLQTDEEPPSPVGRRVAIVRKDRGPGTRARVLGIVHPGFRPFQNREGVRIFDALLGQGRAIYHTGGYLGDGEVIWLLARLPDEIRVRENDLVEPYMLFTNSHNGSIAIDFRLTTVRVVCQNTLSLALTKRPGKAAFKWSHKGDYDTLRVEAGKFFEFCRKATPELQGDFQVMSKIPFGLEKLQEFVAHLLPEPQPPTRVKADSAALRQYQTRLRKILEARHDIGRIFCSGIQNGFDMRPEETLWGALNAVTAFVDHKQPIDGDRYAHILFGSGAALKRSAYNLALSYSPDKKEQDALLK